MLFRLRGRNADNGLRFKNYDNFMFTIMSKRSSLYEDMIFDVATFLQQIMGVQVKLGVCGNDIKASARMRAKRPGNLKHSDFHSKRLRTLGKPEI